MRPLEEPVLVMNKSWMPVSVEPASESMVKMFCGKAVAIDGRDYSTHRFGSWVERGVDPGMPFVKTPNYDVQVPEAIVLTEYGEMPKMGRNFSKYSIFKRDKYTCLAPGTLVQMADGGWNPVERVQIQEQVMTARGPSVVTNRISKVSDKPCVAVKPYYGLPVVVTENHRFMTEEDGRLNFVQAKNLIGKRLAWPLQVGKSRLDSSTVRLIGYYAAEGNRSGKNGVEYHTNFTIAPHEDELAEDIKRCVRELIGKGKHIYDKIQTDARNGNLSRRIRISSVDLARTLSGYVQGKAKNKKFMFNPELLNVKTASILLESAMAGDGCDLMTRNSKTRVLTTASCVLALQMQRLLWRIGRFASIVQGRQTKFNPGAPVYFVRWHPDTERHLGKIVKVDEMKYMSVPIQYVKEAGYSGPVWDLEVFSENDIGHSFVTPAGIAHNCQYCGSQPGREGVTIDHVTPKAQGGKTSWINCVTSCSPCNAGKADQTPAEAGMKLRRKPVRPDPMAMLQIKVKSRAVWRKYVG